MKSKRVTMRFADLLAENSTDIRCIKRLPLSSVRLYYLYRASKSSRGESWQLHQVMTLIFDLE